MKISSFNLNMYNFFTNKRKRPDWSFQGNATSNLTKDFRKKPEGRFLLVVPTGGGKTITAIRVINKLLNEKILTHNDKILWVVHTLSLKDQTNSVLEEDEMYKKFNLSNKLPEIIDVQMKKNALKLIKETKKYKIVVIDEAHHSAAETYQDFFDYNVGILGLTATPRRMDNKNLNFDKISYAITFRSLIKKKIILLPKFLPDIKTNMRINATSLDNEERLELFNNKKRNKLIAKNILKISEKHNLKKIIIFAGTIKHVKNLYEEFKEKKLQDNTFSHIGYIYGNNKNEKNIKNSDYLKWHRLQESSILINCKVLNEGYDDPAIDTVVMATPTSSILYYMQCIGRVVRNPGEKLAKAHVIEITDKLPNVLYRIDNRWLFAEISDFLEPEIHDIKGIWPIRIFKIFYSLILHKAKIKDLSRKEIFEILLGKKISLLLFNDTENPKDNNSWRIFSIKENDEERIKMFNEISENIEVYSEKNHDHILLKKYPEIIKIWPFNSRVYRSSLVASFRNAFNLKGNRKKVNCLKYLSVN